MRAGYLKRPLLSVSAVSRFFRQGALSLDKLPSAISFYSEDIEYPIQSYTRESVDLDYLDIRIFL
jgi:hypothetical protein